MQGSIYRQNGVILKKNTEHNFFPISELEIIGSIHIRGIRIFSKILRGKKFLITETLKMIMKSKARKAKEKEKRLIFLFTGRLRIQS